MADPCKHGHIDGVMHEPCYQCRSEAYEERIAELEAVRDELANGWMFSRIHLPEALATIESALAALRESQSAREKAARECVKLFMMPSEQWARKRIREHFNLEAK